jgi:hypothetical protein
MKLWMNVAAIVVLLVGLVWILQGANVLKGSFMTGQSLWLTIGVIVAIVALGALLWINRRPSP